MVTQSHATLQAADAYFDAAQRWFTGISAAAQARALIDGKLDERALWQSFEGFGLAELLASEADLVERARIVAGVGRAAGQSLYVGPLADSVVVIQSASSGSRRQSDGTDGNWQPALHDASIPTAPGDGTRASEGADLALLATCARLLGAGERVLALAIDHLKTRQQFGRPLAAFQALQHSTVDRHCDMVLGSALLAQTVEHWADAALRTAALHGLKELLSIAAVAAAEYAVQMFGAMGFTHECEVGLYLRHVLTLAARHGTAADHRAAFRALDLDFLK